MEDMSALQHGARLREPARMLDVGRKEPKSFEVNQGEEAALGLLILDEYSYPTQPGDIDDKRTFCTVDNASSPNYTCLDGFSIVKAKVANLSFAAAQEGNLTDLLKEGFTKALYALMKDRRVKAITANCGFMTNFLAYVNETMVHLNETCGLPLKPLLMGTLQLGNVFTNQTDEGEAPGWGLLKEDQRALVVTANSTTLSPNFWSIMDKAGIEDPALQALQNLNPFEYVWNDTRVERFLDRICEKLKGDFCLDPALSVGEAITQLAGAASVRGFNKASQVLNNSGQFFRVFGAQNVKGFGNALADSLDHNASEASASMVKWALDTLFRIKFSPPPNFQGKVGQPEWYKLETPEVDPVWVVFECTELPVYANAIRMFSRLPVWDITTLSQCLMYAALQSDFEYPAEGDMSRSQHFRDCMMSWSTPTKLEKRFGLQPNRTLLGYNYEGEGPARNESLFDWGLPVDFALPGCV